MPDGPIFSGFKYSVHYRIGLVYDLENLSDLRRFLAEGRVTSEDRVTAINSDRYIPVGNLANETDADFDARLAAATELIREPRKAPPLPLRGSALARARMAAGDVWNPLPGAAGSPNSEG